MQQTLVLTVLGPDRTGIVDSLASLVSEHGGSWQESQMARLGGQFAGLVRITCPPENSASLATALETLATSGLQLSVVQELLDEEAEIRTRYELDVLGNDRAGILSEVTRALRTHNANIIEMETRIESAPESGHSIFHSIAMITLLDDAHTQELAKALEALSPDLHVSLTSR